MELQTILREFIDRGLLLKTYCMYYFYFYLISKDQSLVYKDAVFLSPHKFVGGVGTPGLCVVTQRVYVTYLYTV